MSANTGNAIIDPTKHNFNFTVDLKKMASAKKQKLLLFFFIFTAFRNQHFEKSIITFSLIVIIFIHEASRL